MKELISSEELYERICEAIASMSREDLCDLYNREFGDGLKYVDDDIFEQETNYVGDTIPEVSQFENGSDSSLND